MRARASVRCGPCSWSTCAILRVVPPLLARVVENNSRTVKQYLSGLTQRRVVLCPPPRVSFEGFKVSTNQWARSLLNVRVRH